MKQNDVWNERIFFFLLYISINYLDMKLDIVDSEIKL